MIPLPVTGAAAAVVVAAALMLPHAAASPSSVGAGIQAAPVRLTVAPGTAGHAHVTVVDTGSGTETLAVRAYRLGSQGRMVPASWVRAEGVTLAPGTEGSSLVTVTVPAGTPPGRYRGDILASRSSDTGGGLSLGAAALTGLVVIVA